MGYFELKTSDDVKRIVERYGGCRDPFELARRMGRIVMEAPLVGMRGFYHYSERQHLICVNSELEGLERDFVCAHELAHSIYHKDLGVAFISAYTQFPLGRFEREADRFAVDMVVTDDMALAAAHRSVYDISRQYCISEDAVRYRFADVQLKME